MSDKTRISLKEAGDLIHAAVAATGLPDAIAGSVARALVAAEAEGQVGHGFSRLGDYVAQVRSGKIKASAQITISERGPASILVDADCGFAFPALDAAIDALVPRAQASGIAVAAIANSHHCGALSVQVERLANAGLIGIMVANTPKAMAPWGASAALFGTNPIAFAAPQADGPPLVIDLSLSRVARGKVMAASKAGISIPEGWALDEDGQPTTDPKAALAGTMVPIGGAKGTALALMVEVLAASFTGSAFSHQAASFLAPEGLPPQTGQTLIAIKPDPEGDFLARMSELLETIVAQPGARLPGTRRRAALAQSVAEGMDVPNHLVDLARRLADGA
ncbi:MAG: Ldh family oxidoreductase [Pseudomonadota bacterium]